jgi:hypothetical protein
MLTVAALDPGEAGWKTIGTVQLAPAANAPPQVERRLRTPSGLSQPWKSKQC